MKKKKKTLVMYGDHKWNWQGTSSCIGWELPETRKEKLRSKLCTNTYNIK
jgi:hypothetical protein